MIPSMVLEILQTFGAGCGFAALAIVLPGWLRTRRGRRATGAGFFGSVRR